VRSVRAGYSFKLNVRKAMNKKLEKIKFNLEIKKKVGVYAAIGGTFNSIIIIWFIDLRYMWKTK